MNKVKLVGNVVPLKKKDTKGKETDVSVQERTNGGEKFYSITFKVVTDEKKPNWILCSTTSKEKEYPFKLNTDYYLEGHLRSWSKDGKVGQSVQIDYYKEITQEEKRMTEESKEQILSGSLG